MAAVHWLLQILSSLIINMDPLECSKITDNIYNYMPLSHASFCTRRLNLTGQVGCSSSTTGNSGVALFMNESEDIMQTLDSDTSTPFVILASVKHFTNASLMRFFMSTRNVRGLIVFSDDVDGNNDEFSESSKCPNGLYSAYNVTKQCDLDIQWNPAGTDYAYIDWPFPVVLVADANNTIRVL
ncbi:hypothetical protein MN116_003776 [Schistosoma mekongi]|uniref:Nicastrin n=1 Tax=Schistosoma mekongi TaxID=38744 RepID=A0AAE1ZEU7_SCHME|nr:hypothetical protein MN116_003776 [Schistosoma mekongi]